MDRFRHLMKSLLFPKSFEHSCRSGGACLCVCLRSPVRLALLYLLYSFSGISYLDMCASDTLFRPLETGRKRLETAMLTQFGGENSLAFRHIMTGYTGGGVCTLILGIAIYMLCRAAKEIKTLELEGKPI